MRVAGAGGRAFLFLGVEGRGSVVLGKAGAGERGRASGSRDSLVLPSPTTTLVFVGIESRGGIDRRRCTCLSLSLSPCDGEVVSWAGGGTGTRVWGTCTLTSLALSTPPDPDDTLITVSLPPASPLGSGEREGGREESCDRLRCSLVARKKGEEAEPE